MILLAVARGGKRFRGDETESCSSVLILKDDFGF